MPNHRAIVRNRQFEPETTKVFDRLVRTGDVLVDIGANFGWYTLRAAARKEVQHVYAFEPSAQMACLLRDAVKLNDLRSKCTIFPFALSREAGVATLRTFEQLDPMHASLFPLGDVAWRGERVVTKTLDDVSVSFRKQPDIVKCDVEGAERDVLLGSASVLQGRCGDPPVWLLEANYETASMAGFLPWDLIDIASSIAPYRPFRIQDGAVVPLVNPKGLRHGDTLILAIPSSHSFRFE
jgi:FkbM family methyltransferase